MKKALGVLLLVVAAMTARAQVTCLPGSLSSGMMAFYPFSSGSINDYSGHSNHLSNPTSAAPTADRFGNASCAYHFSAAAGDYLHVPMPGASFVDGITSSPFSISLWFQGNSAAGAGGFEVLIGRGLPGSSGHCPDTWQQWSLALYDCRQPVSGFDRRSLWAQWPGSTDCATIMAHFVGSWHHLALVYTGTARKLYLDNVLYSTVSDTCGPPTMDINDLVLGNTFTGDLDDIIIYNRALTTSEVSSLYGASACCGTTMPTIVSNNTLAPVSAGVKVYPNPSGGDITVSSGGVIRHVSVCTATCAEYAAWVFESNQVSIDIKDLAPGIYFLKVTTDSETTIEKLIKQ